jgi:hypothetical protein
MKEYACNKPHTFREGFLEKGKQETAAHNQITILQFEIEPVQKEGCGSWRITVDWKRKAWWFV